METFSIMRMDEEHLEEICLDIKRQYDEGIANCVLFDMQLQPAGNPLIDKTTQFCRKYDAFSNRLNDMGLQCGILIQNSIANVSIDIPLQNIVNLSNGEEINVCCPFDDGYMEYLEKIGAELAKHNPAVIMLDDDFRLITHRVGMGCACPKHMSEFNMRAKTNLTRDELFQILTTDKDTPYLKIFLEIQEETIVNAARALRKGIDSVNRGIRGVYCSCGGEAAPKVAKVLAGEKNPVTVRINNDNYHSEGGKGFSHSMIRAATDMAVMRNKGVDVFLAETDTCPHNRYAKSAQSLHAHYTGSILEGVNGAKHWITMMKHFDLDSGEAYRRILAKNKGFYEKLEQVVSEYKPFGCKIPISCDIDYGFTSNEKSYYLSNEGWATQALERLGFPLFFSEREGGAAFFNGNRDAMMTDSQIMKILKGVVILASDTAQNLIKRGFGEYLGVDIREWNGEKIDGELIGNDIVQKQENAMELVLADKRTKPLSMMYHQNIDGTKKLLFPGSTIFANSIGGLVVIFSGTPKADNLYYKGFSFLNPARKKQLTKILNMADSIPVYYPGDAEVYMRGAYMPDGKIFCGIFNLSYDIMDNIVLTVKNEVESVEMLDSNGYMKKCDFEVNDGRIVVNQTAYPLNPVILFISTKNK